MGQNPPHHLKELVEKIGVVIEKTGSQPAVGRVLGCLLVSDPPQKTFDEIHEYLGISKSAVSNALNILMSREIVDYFTVPGDRRRYFRLSLSGWFELIRKQTSFHSAIPELLRDVLAARSTRYPEFNKGLKDAIEFLAFMEKERNAALEKWEIMKGRR
jgi:DNA-binding transcriptional regulator GbsR (MarR family)